MIKYLLAILMFCSVAYADVEPLFIQPDHSNQIKGCKKYEFCSAQTATGDCTALPASGDERVLRVAGRSVLTFYSTQSIGVHTCNVMSNDTGHDALSGVGQQINAASLTATAMTLTLAAPFDYIWITCPTIVTSATVTALICPASN